MPRSRCSPTGVPADLMAWLAEPTLRPAAHSSSGSMVPKKKFPARRAFACVAVKEYESNRPAAEAGANPSGEGWLAALRQIPYFAKIQVAAFQGPTDEIHALLSFRYC